MAHILQEMIYHRVPFFIFQKTQELVHSVPLVGLTRRVIKEIINNNNNKKQQQPDLKYVTNVLPCEYRVHFFDRGVHFAKKSGRVIETRPMTIS